ncbi:hypothetical protein L1887_06959 [Cichorium endivia]|nr:hypothetical protein L1887_06959 [Cichorium endivia]
MRRRDEEGEARVDESSVVLLPGVNYEVYRLEIAESIPTGVGPTIDDYKDEEYKLFLLISGVTVVCWLWQEAMLWLVVRIYGLAGERGEKCVDSNFEYGEWPDLGNERDKSYRGFKRSHGEVVVVILNGAVVVFRR